MYRSVLSSTDFDIARLIWSVRFLSCIFESISTPISSYIFSAHILRVPFVISAKIRQLMKPWSCHTRNKWTNRRSRTKFLIGWCKITCGNIVSIFEEIILQNRITLKRFCSKSTVYFFSLLTERPRTPVEKFFEHVIRSYRFSGHLVQCRQYPSASC